MAEEQLQGNTRPRPDTDDPVWRFLFDRFDSVEDKLDEVKGDVGGVRGDVETLKQHVNEEQDKFTQLLATTVRKDGVLRDLWSNFRTSRPAQAVVAVIVVAMSPVVAHHWDHFLESVRSAF